MLTSNSDLPVSTSWVLGSKYCVIWELRFWVLGSVVTGSLWRIFLSHIEDRDFRISSFTGLYLAPSPVLNTMWVTIAVQKITKVSCGHTCLILPLRKDHCDLEASLDYSVKLPLKKKRKTHNFRWSKIRAREMESMDRAGMRSRNCMSRIHINPNRYVATFHLRMGQAEVVIPGFQISRRVCPQEVLLQ